MSEDDMKGGVSACAIDGMKQLPQNQHGTYPPTALGLGWQGCPTAHQSRARQWPAAAGRSSDHVRLCRQDPCFKFEFLCC